MAPTVPNGPILPELVMSPAAQGTDAVSSDYLKQIWWYQAGLNFSGHFHGKEAALVYSALPGIAKSVITAARLCHAEQQLQL